MMNSEGREIAFMGRDHIVLELDKSIQSVESRIKNSEVEIEDAKRSLRCQRLRLADLHKQLAWAKALPVDPISLIDPVVNRENEL